MFQKLDFNFKQAVFNVKRSVMTIITLTLAISMIAGLFYYFDAFEREASQSSTRFGSFSLDVPQAFDKIFACIAKNNDQVPLIGFVDVFHLFIKRHLGIDKLFQHQHIYL